MFVFLPSFSTKNMGLYCLRWCIFSFLAHGTYAASQRVMVVEPPTEPFQRTKKLDSWKGSEHIFSNFKLWQVPLLNASVIWLFSHFLALKHEHEDPKRRIRKKQKWLFRLSGTQASQGGDVEAALEIDRMGHMQMNFQQPFTQYWKVVVK